ncbi:flagellar basal body L-ring protein FlgH [Thiohalobacter sp. IOR34]|uniref:flagellar basal body L-ring protein FlgH n=1 Tax=Thiohalobacter sp. IOR34 TaxID=3057176 RepID=UPI0025B13F3C|nr:flagellar basal body L-ring protein FlgH [Thiohalobacter sp. IOR34]WJW74608.1 flagellar basal body L-ring protein FlgH [Thiohalobacter sp. IOR34]
MRTQEICGWLLRCGVVLLLGGLLGGCATVPHQHPSYRPVMPPMPKPPPQTDGSIYQPGFATPLFEDLKARRVGDILTIVLQEKTQASKKATTSTKKETGLTAANPTLLGSALRFDIPLLRHAAGRANTLQNTLDSSSDFTGEGDSKQSNSLSGNITVTVAEVLPNGNLYVRGEKWLTLNQGDEFIQISGIVRPTDIRADNSVLSGQVADARITYSGKGTLADANSMGWLARFFNSPIWPF